MYAEVPGVFGDKRQEDLISYLEGCDLRSDLDNFANGLMA